MNKNIEIKVNNGQELIAQAKKYKNSGGEWRLREKYLELANGKVKKRKNKLGWGIVISNSKQTIDIYSINDNLSREAINNEINVRPELHQLFPEAKEVYFASDEKNGPWGDGIGRPLQSNLDGETFKQAKKDNETFRLVRCLVAENSWHLKQILHEYVRNNETKIYQSSNPHFSGWVEIIDGQDGNMYLYVGEKNADGGREIKIGIAKSEFYSQPNHNFYVKKGGGTYSHEEMLELNWNLFTITRPRTSAEEREYYSKTGGLEEEWLRNSPHLEKLCRKYLEDLREQLNKILEYWKKQSSPLSGGMDMLTTTIVYIDAIDHELEVMKKNRPAYYAACDKDCAVCGVKLCCHFEGQACSESKNNVAFDKELIHNYGLSPEPKENKNNQLTDKEKLLNLFQKYNLKKSLLITENW